MIQKQQHSLLNKAEEACDLLRGHLKQDHVVRIISHNDADGISAAGVMCNAIAKENGKFHVTIVPRLKDEVISKFLKEKYKLFIFCDMGSANLKSISRLKGDVIIADHHQTNPKEKLEIILFMSILIFMDWTVQRMLVDQESLISLFDLWDIKT